MSININNSKIEEVNININNDEIKEIDIDEIQGILSIYKEYKMFETLLSNDDRELTLIVKSDLSDFRVSTIRILDFSDISEELINDILKYIKKYKSNLAKKIQNILDNNNEDSK